MQIKDYELIPIPTGIFGLDGGSMFGTVPKVLWEKTNPPDEQNRIEMEARALLLKGRDRRILIDCGNGSDFVAKYGEKLGNKFAEIYAVKAGGANLLDSLAKAGLKTEDITDVILTHLHFDHAGGAVCERGGKLVPTFQNAQYYVQKANLEVASKPNVRERASYLPANFTVLQEHGVLTLLDGPSEIAPGVSVFLSNGHTQGQQLVKVTDGKNTAVYCGDLIPTSSHVRLPWIMGYDLNPLLLIEEKSQLLSAAADGHWHLFFEHDPKRAFAQVERSGADFKAI